MLSQKDVKLVEAEYYAALEDMTFVNRGEAAFNAADNAALALSYQNHGVRFITEVTAEMRKLIRREATSLRRAAIGM